MNRVRAALFLDFDNVFGGLHKIDPQAAIDFAEHPNNWLSALADSYTVAAPRRWLVLRCYMNPAGWVPTHDPEQPRLYFSRFRPTFTQAGFEVIDCPRLSSTKNAADIRLVLDAVDASMAVPAYEEFVIASGDSDMTPLLVRLRAADRRTTIMSPSDAADAFIAVADRLVGADEVLALVQGDLSDSDESVEEETPSDDAGVALGRARSLIRERYSSAEAPLNMARLASEVAQEMSTAAPAGLPNGRWFGAGTFVQFLTSLDLPHMQVSQHYVWDASRHSAPPDRKSDDFGFPSPVERLTVEFKLPRLARESWRPIFEALADYAKTHDFRLTEATKWGRDRLAERGIAVNRQAVGIVTRAAAFGGAPLHGDPPPTGEEIGAAFVRNLIGRAIAAGHAITEQDAAEIDAWFGWQDTD